MSDLAVTNIRMENYGVESLGAAPVGLTGTALGPGLGAGLAPTM
jgi:hypothetical protein